MEKKKNPIIDIENYRSIFLLCGLFTAIFLVYLALEWQNTEESNAEYTFINKSQTTDEEWIPITTQDELQYIPPPKIEITNIEQISEVIDIVSDTTKIKVENNPINTPIVKESNTTNDMQIEETAADDGYVYLVVDEMPEYPGGEQALIEYIAKNTSYPDDARIKKAKGTVVVKFMVSKTGEISNISVKNGIYPSLDSEAVRVIRILPKWNPGMQRGKPVNVWCMQPFIFTLP